MNEVDARKTAIWHALGTVIDPELGLDVVTLGLIYDVDVEADVARVTHTLTTPGCPMAGTITNGIREAALQAEGIHDVETMLTWDPAWHPGMIAPGSWPS